VHLLVRYIQRIKMHGETVKTLTSCSAISEPAHTHRESRYECDKTPAAVKEVVFLSAIAKSRKAAVSFVMSVRPHGTTRLPLDGFS
jgi:hypothetical protein